MRQVRGERGREQALKQTRRVSDDEFSGADFKAAILTCGGIWIFMSEGRVCKKTGLHPLVCTEQIQKDNLEAEELDPCKAGAGTGQR